MRSLLFVLMATLQGCATHSLQNPYNFTQFDDDRLCSGAKWVQATHNQDGVIAPYLAEVSKRKLMTEDEFNSVFKRRADIGDRYCYMLATRGKPDTFNVTRLPKVEHVQWVYRGFAGHNTYIYTENDVITAIQY
jgi:hypothetical protein